MKEDNAVELAIVSNLVLPLIKDILAPKIKKVVSRITNINSDDIEIDFEEYLVRRYEKFMIIDTIAFPNKQTLFDRLYEPLTIYTRDTDINKDVKIKINGFPDNFIPNYCRVIIEDTAGMGKSTITKKLFKSIIEDKIGIPILIELRQISKINPIIKEIQNQITPLGKKISQDLILKIINEGEFLFMFDGIDEISNEDRDFVLKDLHKFIEKAGDNYFQITSRPDDSLASFGDFRKFRIEPLNQNEAFSLINRYDKYSHKPIADKLIEEIKFKKENSLIQFLENPLLVSLLYKSYEFKKDIPIKKNQFYWQVFEALYQSHDFSKEGYFKRKKFSKLHLDDFDRVLRHVGYFTSIANKIEYEVSYILNIINKTKGYVKDLKFKSSDFLKDLLESVPIFKKEGNNVKWAHKSLQDYFAAKFIWMDAKSNEEKILNKIFNDNDNQKFFNVLELFYELDPQTFDRTITLWILEDFENYYNHGCEKSKIDSEKLKTRLGNLYNKEIVIKLIDNNKKQSNDLYSTEYALDDNGVLSGTLIEISTEFGTININYSMKNNINTIIQLLFKLKKSFIATYNSSESLIVREVIKYFEGNSIKKIVFDNRPDNIVNKVDVYETFNLISKIDFCFLVDEALKTKASILKSKKRITHNELLDW